MSHGDVKSFDSFCGFSCSWICHMINFCKSLQNYKFYFKTVFLLIICFVTTVYRCINWVFNHINLNFPPEIIKKRRIIFCNNNLKWLYDCVACFVWGAAMNFLLNFIKCIKFVGHDLFGWLFFVNLTCLNIEHLCQH